MLAAGRLKLPTEEHAREYLEYPNYGDMRKVRPSIRAAEGGFLIAGENLEWSNKFWKNCLDATDCFPLHFAERIQPK